MKTLNRLQIKTKIMLMRLGLFGGLAWVIADKVRSIISTSDVSAKLSLLDA